MQSTTPCHPQLRVKMTDQRRFGDRTNPRPRSHDLPPASKKRWLLTAPLMTRTPPPQAPGYCPSSRFAGSPGRSRSQPSSLSPSEMPTWGPAGPGHSFIPLGSVSLWPSLSQCSFSSLGFPPTWSEASIANSSYRSTAAKTNSRPKSYLLQTAQFNQTAPFNLILAQFLCLFYA
jgi:hypothetical protein